MKSHALLFRLTVAVALAWIPVAAEGQHSEKMPRVGWLANQSPSFPAYEGFRQGLVELGYVEGRNIRVEFRSAEGNLERLPELVRELVGLNVDVLYVAGDQGLKAAKEATATIPIVVFACDPLDSLVASIARPGGKATGFTCISSDMAGKRLQTLKELIPTLSRTAVLYNPEDRNKAPEYKQTQEAARSLGLILSAFEARSAGDIDAVFAEIINDQAQALLVLPDPLMNFHVRKLADLALRGGLPAMYGFREFAEAGGLVSYGATLREGNRRAAAYVDKIIKGAKPGDLPIEQPTKFELVINLNTAKALGLTIPESFLLRADEVIE